MELLHKDSTDKIIKAFYKVYNEFGFLEKVYENALFLELIAMGLYLNFGKNRSSKENFYQ